MKTIVSERKEDQKTTEREDQQEIISYRMTCSESGNGLSHYIMYGDVPEEN